MGRLETTTATKVSRQAQRLPLTAPSGPDCGKGVLVGDCVDVFRRWRTYGQDRYGTDGTCQYDEDGAAEQQHQCQPTSQRGVYAPQKLLSCQQHERSSSD
jgi:hypothetical protein